MLGLLQQNSFADNRQSSFHEVSRERRRWPEKFTRHRRAASLIEKETLKKRISNIE
jgi:hypothetical protein